MKTSLHRIALRLARVAAGPTLLWLALLAPAWANQAFESPERAMDAFGEAAAKNDDASLRRLFGNDFRELIPSVGVRAHDLFVAAWGRSHAIRRDGETRAQVAVGSEGWTFPIPIVKTTHGWEFDTKAGLDEMRLRRIGRNELSVMQTLLAIHDAQQDYVSTTQDKNGVSAYASKLTSSPGKRDGLYWPTKAGEPPSPIGPALAAAGAGGASTDGYFGYRYKLLTSQGPHAPGGKYDYVVKGKLFGGYAVIAWPVRYGDTGVKTFMVSHDGQIYERDLGPATAAQAGATKIFDPGPGWEKVSP
jgi:hypothetical protein